MIKAIFFDIDGTLIPMGTTKIPDDTLTTLKRLRKKGIKLFIATGRPPNSIKFVTDQFTFDGILSANGQYCFNSETIIHEQCIPNESYKTLIPYVEENKIALTVALLNQSFVNRYNQKEFDWQTIDLYELCDKNIIQIMAYIKPDEDERFLAHLPHCKSVRWSDAFADIIPEDGGKDRGIDHILDYYGISLKNAMSIGDGGNDICMLDHTPYAVVMGNANENVKAHASYVTANATDDGITQAMKHYGVLD